MFGGRGGCGPSRASRKSASSPWSAGLKRRSKPIVVEAFELIAAPQSEPATWPGKTSTPSPSSTSRRRLWKRPSAPSRASTARSGRAGIADEERVAGEDEPRLVAAGAVDHREAAVLGPVARRVDRAQDDVADLDLCPVLERLVREGRPGLLVDADRDAVLEREAAVSRDVVGVRVRLEDADEPDVVPLDLRQHGFDVIRRVDDDRDAGVLVADEVRGAAQVVVQELLESTARRYHRPPLCIRKRLRPGAATLARAPRRAAASTNQPIASRKTSVCSPFMKIPPRFWSRTATGPTAAARARRTSRTAGWRRCTRGRGTTSRRRRRRGRPGPPAARGGR